jgi:hypothetical protein
MSVIVPLPCCLCPLLHDLPFPRLLSSTSLLLLLSLSLLFYCGLCRTGYDNLARPLPTYGRGVLAAVLLITKAAAVAMIVPSLLVMFAHPYQRRVTAAPPSGPSDCIVW